MTRPIDMLEQEKQDRMAAMNESIQRLLIFKKAIYKMASVRHETPDDFIRAAKQAIADYEKAGGIY